MRFRGKSGVAIIAYRDRGDKRVVLGLLFLMVAAASNGREMPGLLEAALAKHRELRLIRPDKDFPGGYTEKQIRGFGYWPPWCERDMDRDGRTDVAAAVEVDSAGQPRFGVAAIFASSRDSLRWIVEPQQHWIFGVADGYARGSLTPLFCLECDTNGWCTWSGRAFEDGLFVVGDSVAIASYTENATLALFDSPRVGAGIARHVAPCTRGIVEKVAGTRIDRWYLVRLEGGGRAGWVPGRMMLPVDCPED
jgi:hypothetical protein